MSGSRVQLWKFNDRPSMAPLLDIFERAQTIECELRPAYDETRIWFRFNESERSRLRDGLSLPQTGVTGWRVPLLEWYLKHGNAKRWHNKRSIEAYMKRFRRGLASAQSLLLLITATNTPSDWLAAGRAYTRVGLAAAKRGLCMHPYSQVLQEYPEMAQLQREFNELLGVSGERKVQMAVRIGRAPPSYFSYRRHLASFVTTTGGSLRAG